MLVGRDRRNLHGAKVTMMSTTKTCLALFVLLVASSCELVAQGARYLIPERIERATVADDDGQLQWAEWTAPACGSCKGTGKSVCATCARFAKDAKDCPECQRKDPKLLTTCRACAGTGKIADPLDEVPCAGCMGAGMLLCTVCGGGGRLKVGGAKRWSKCPACRGAGKFDCGACKGKRVMASLAIKPSLREADLDKLQKASRAVDEALELFGKFAPQGGTRARKEVKELGKAYDAMKKFHPSFKAMVRSTKSYMSKIFAGAQFQGHEENEANTMNRLKANAEYYLKHQKRMLDLAIKRAEANDSK